MSDQNGVITDYFITLISLNATGISQQLITKANITLTVPNLTPFTTYDCLVAARTAVGRGPFSNIVSVQTPEAGKQQQQQQQ